MRSGGPAMRLIGMGWYVAICIILGVVGGIQLDKVTDTGKLFTVVGLFVGLFFGLLGGWLQLKEVLDVINRRRTGGND
ncbi:MAG TPA: AtpZ/AtpI family protein [Dehalococcoidia bacterium]|nr:AtpZ/AtpI family protein [Dehalococcoidia bacterium]